MRAVAIAHPNVALIKYWGKRREEGNLPATGSLSVTLGALSTRTSVYFDAALESDVVRLNGAADAGAAARVTACLDVLRARAGVRLRARVESSNDFPTGAGLASSASGYAALVRAACGALGLELDAADMARVARIGSGSAARSMHGGFVLLRNEDDDTASIPLLAPEDWPLSVVVAVTSTSAKAIGSREGMRRSATTSPCYGAWLETHPEDLRAAEAAVRARDFAALAELAEHSCLKMHAVMMTTRPPLLYWAPATLACLHRVRELREGGANVFFTVDAGPQVKAVCDAAALPAVRRALAAVPGVVDVIESPLGDGARLVDR